MVLGDGEREGSFLGSSGRANGIVDGLYVFGHKRKFPGAIDMHTTSVRTFTSLDLGFRIKCFAVLGNLGPRTIVSLESTLKMTNRSILTATSSMSTL